MHLQVNVDRLNKRRLIPVTLPDDSNIVGKVLRGFTFEGVKIDAALLPNPLMGAWYKDRDGYYYWGGGLMEISEAIAVGLDEAVPGAEKVRIINPAKLGWGLKMLHFQDFWNHAGNMGNDVTIAVLDTGIARAHPDFDYARIKQFNILDGSQNAEDRDGHGTHIAGIIAAQGNEVAGSAPYVQLAIIKISEKVNEWKIEDLVKGIEEAILLNADIISISGEFHRLDPKLPLLKTAVLKAHQKGITIVGSSGNNFSGLPADYYPAAFDECISVGSIKQDKKRADYSNLSTKLDLVSPGDQILSTWLNGTYKADSGTSMATPLVAGMIAVLKSFARSQKQKELTPGEIYILITKTADEAGPDGHDVEYGFGIVNPLKALTSI
jgi:major intracellular serine protease